MTGTPTGPTVGVTELRLLLADAFLGVTQAEEVLFWTGAGISIDAPACAPAGRQMTTRLLSRYFEPGVLDTLVHYYRALDIFDLNSGKVRTLPRFESVLQAITDHYGRVELEGALAPLVAGQSNVNHRLFASHLDRGGSHITANFDGYIEAAANRPLRGRLLHFHGAFGDPELGATISSVESGFSEVMRGELKSKLGPPAKLVVVCGYSGSDYFDVDPLLRDARQLPVSGRVIIWVEHHDALGEVVRVDHRAADIPRQLDWLRKAGANCWYVRCPTQMMLAAVGTQVGLRPPPQMPSAVIDPWWDEGGPALEERQLATVQLYSSFGLVSEVLARQDGLPTSPTAHSQLAQAAWHKGRYRQALRHWRGAYRGRTWNDTYARWERSIAVAQVRGQTLRGELQLELASAALERLSPLSATDTWSLEEHRAKGLMEMARTPGLSWLVTPTQIRRAADKVDAARQATTGIHAESRLSAAAAGLNEIKVDTVVRRGEDAGDELDLSGRFDEQFAEAEALNATLNYRHRRLRAFAADLDIRSQTDRDQLSKRLRNHIRHQLELGMDGDAARSAFLPHAHIALSRGRVRELVHNTDVSFWHRQRLMSFDLLRRLDSVSILADAEAHTLSGQAGDVVASRLR